MSQLQARNELLTVEKHRLEQEAIGLRRQVEMLTKERDKAQAMVLRLMSWRRELARVVRKLTGTSAEERT